MPKFIPYGRQDISQNDIDAVVQTLQSEFLTQGPAIEAFENAVALYAGAKFAIAVNSATSALHIACLAAGLGPQDLFWTTPNSFVASANCGLYCGAEVDFVDIDPQTYNLSPLALEKKLAEAKKQGRLPKLIIPVHFAGQSCEMVKIKELADSYQIKIIEDASHAIGGSYTEKKIGSCEFSDMTVFSFHPVKVMTTGEGGMILTNSPDLYDRLLRLRTHGITRDSSAMEGASHGPWYYQQIELGYNYRITDIQAALGLSQLKRLDEFVTKRHQIAATYNQQLKQLPLTLPFQHTDTYSAYHLYVIQLNEAAKQDRPKVFNKLRESGLGVNVHYIPIHTQPYYQKMGFQLGDFPNAEAYYESAISIPMYPGLSESDQASVIQYLQSALA